MLPPPRRLTPHCGRFCWYSEWRHQDSHYHGNAKRKRFRKGRLHGEDRARRDRLREEAECQS